jgi:uncharacterized protein
MNVCQQCGACCAFYRVSFYWAEAAQLKLPDSAIERVNEHIACMAGTMGPSHRCHALHGKVGEEVVCTIYATRPSPCREVQPGDEQCNRARAAHGLAPLEGQPSP